MIKRRIPAALSAVLAVLPLLPGCATLNPGESFPAVAADVSRRTGARIAWSSGSADDVRISAELAQTLAHELSADQAVQIAMLGNQKLQAAYEELGISQAQLVQAGLLTNPVFDAMVRFPAGGGKPDIEFGVAENFLTLFAIPLRKQIAAAEYESAKARISVEVLALAADTRSAYLGLVAARARVTASREIFAADDAAASAATALRAAGNITAVHADEHSVAALQSGLMVQDAEAAELTARARLESCLGLPSPALQVPDHLPDPGRQPLEVALPALARPDVALAAAELDAAYAQLGLTRHSLITESGLRVSSERDLDSPWVTGPGVAIPIPIFDTGKARNAVASARIRQSADRLQALRVQAANETAAAHARLDAAGKRLEFIRQKLLPLRHRLTHETQLEYNAATAGVFQLLDARRHESEAQLDLIDAQAAYWQADVDLERATGHRPQPQFFFHQSADFCANCAARSRSLYLLQAHSHPRRSLMDVTPAFGTPASSTSRRDLLSDALKLTGLVTLVGPAAAIAQTTPAPPSNPAPVPAADSRYAPVIVPNGWTLPYTLIDGVKVWHLVAEEVDHAFAPGLSARCWGYNGSVHGPVLEAVEGDRVRIFVTNRLPEATTVHWHGIVVPSGMDGVGGLNQSPIEPGETYVYEFDLRQSGTLMYHSHHDEMTQMALGLTGMFIIHPKVPSVGTAIDRDFVLLLHEWRIDPGTSRPNPIEMTDFNVLTINARIFPATAPLLVQKGDRVRIRLGNLGAMDHHPMHLHGHRFTVTETDGGPIPESARRLDSAILVPVGTTRTIEFVADNPGDWSFHCHMTHHVMNQMGHNTPNMTGVNPAALAPKIKPLLPGYMTMGHDGMAAMGEMAMPTPPNSLPMAGGTGPLGYITMGGMFTILKIRDNMATYSGATPPPDPGWYAPPPGTLAQPASFAQLQANHISVENPPRAPAR